MRCRCSYVRKFRPILQNTRNEKRELKKTKRAKIMMIIHNSQSSIPIVSNNENNNKRNFWIHFVSCYYFVRSTALLHKDHSAHTRVGHRIMADDLGPFEFFVSETSHGLYLISLHLLTVLLHILYLPRKDCCVDYTHIIHHYVHTRTVYRESRCAYICKYV